MTLRAERVASLIKEEVGMLFAREYSDPAYGFITVTEVHMSPDLKIAKIYVSIMGAPDIKEKTLKMLEGHKGNIRSYVGSHMRLKFTPAIHFYIDETMDRVDKINRLLKEIHKDDDRKNQEL